MQLAAAACVVLRTLGFQACAARGRDRWRDAADVFVDAGDELAAVIQVARDGDAISISSVFKVRYCSHQDLDDVDRAVRLVAGGLGGGTVAYTVGHQESYDRALADEPVVRKLGRSGSYPGGWVFRDLEAAIEVARAGRLPDRDEHVCLAVYLLEMPGAWEACVSPEPDQNGVQRLLVDARIVRRVWPMVGTWPPP